MEYDSIVLLTKPCPEAADLPAGSRVFLLKRSIDLILGLAGFLVALPLMVVIAVLVRLDSPGPALYTQSRMGRGGCRFKMWKFRTMVDGAEAVLEQYLAANPAAQAEWDLNQKLKHDPRITHMGHILRKLSLDELPQFWNILLGDMSLVGPRPIVADEIRHYADRFHWYTSVRPGLTGLWQVSGRNNLGCAVRVALDEYYVRNWSVWMDIDILLRTGWVVLRGDGAY
jgi:Undecaprenyl-phosphate galactose phosphotransferase WbaP